MMLTKFFGYALSLSKIILINKSQFASAKLFFVVYIYTGVYIYI